MIHNYTLHFNNHSINAGSMMVFQKDPNSNLRNVLSLAWFTKYMYPETYGRFDWKNNYSFLWAETGILKPGVFFYTAQTVDANLTNQNSIELTYDKAFNFVNKGSSNPKGSLCIKQGVSVPFNKAAVGIGMNGDCVFSTQAQPNIELTLTPHSTYWIAFGDFTQGEVLDIQAINNATEINFPTGVYAMNATLNRDNTWTIKECQ